MNFSSSLSRRQLLCVLPAAGAGCLGCMGACAGAGAALRSGEKADMTWEQLFAFAYGRNIALMSKLAEQVGRKQFVEMIAKASDAATVEGVAKIPIPPEKRDLAAWMAPVRGGNAMMEHAVAFEFVKDTPTEAALKVHECLWAKTFRDGNAADIGYAWICGSDFAAVTAFNPKIKMTRTKTLMQGDAFCDHRYVMTG